ncbi:MAG: DUF2256 domain-containing protein [Ilumatobacteraceae bacterium]|nr:DUF2256 domain-containing protein [Ilumatobacteraceae bacterium]
MRDAPDKEKVSVVLDQLMARQAKTKNGFSPKICVRCSLPFEWRKKWAKNWDEVKYCSTRCRDDK